MVTLSFYCVSIFMNRWDENTSEAREECIAILLSCGADEIAKSYFPSPASKKPETIVVNERTWEDIIKNIKPKYPIQTIENIRLKALALKKNRRLIKDYIQLYNDNKSCTVVIRFDSNVFQLHTVFVEARCPSMLYLASI